MACRTCAPSSPRTSAGSSITASPLTPCRRLPAALVSRAMKFTLAWLKEHLDTRASVAEIADTLTRIGLEVEEVFDPATALGSFKVAEVLKAEKHPNADKLQVCEVDTGS